MQAHQIADIWLVFDDKDAGHVYRL
jgi:hypothetical protein